MAGATVQPVSLHHATRERYLSYALSVITSRALPDVRDGLKPVQRRILYAMFNDMGLRPGGRYRKCAAVVGEVMGKYHPHGDQSIYDALVRMAQPFSLRAPLVDGQGNFGSLDGDPPAAMRYTECKLQPLAEELLSELRKRTVDFRPNYDGQLTEPIVLPAQFPQLLVNGCEGIAVGMATRVPPHNLAEVIKACVALIDDRSLTVKQILRRYIKGPDFPTGGRILNDQANIVEFYENGQGSFRLRALWGVEKEGRKKQIIISSVPYGQNKARLIEKLGQQVRERKLPQVVDVRDESTDDVRIVLELKQGANADAVMAYVFKHTPLECTWPMNLTALVPTPGSDVPTPARLDLKSVLEHWLDFRFETVRRRFEYDLKKLLERIHILEGFEIIFDALDEAIAIIRSSEGRRHAAEELIDRFDLSDIQAEAILELKLYRLAKLEILQIREELEEKRAEAARIEQILASDGELWAVVRAELIELKKLYGDKRRTEMEGGKELVYDEEAFIIKEDTFIIVTRDGWIKRQSSFSDISKIRVREDDEIGWLIKAHTRSSITFFSTLGSAYVMRVDSVPSTTGYGEPLQRFFAFADGERVCGVVSHDARHRVRVQETLIQAPGDVPPPPYGIALTRRGRVLRFSLANHEEPSTKSGRRYARVGPDGDAVLAVYPTTGTEKVCVASRFGRAILFPVSEVAILKSSGRGTLGIKLRDNDEAMAFELAEGTLDGPEVITGQGRSLVVRERKFGVGKRGGRGKIVLKRGEISTWVRGPSIHLGKGERLPSSETPPESSRTKAENDDEADIGVTVIGTTIGEA